MVSTPPQDPMQMWREALGEFEASVNAFASRGMKQSEAIPQGIHQMFNAMLGMQHLQEQMEAARAKLLDMPRRKDITALAEALQRIEEKVDRLLPAAPVEASPKPPRTRRPASAGAAAAPAAEGGDPSGASAKAPRVGSRRSRG